MQKGDRHRSGRPELHVHWPIYGAADMRRLSSRIRTSINAAVIMYRRWRRFSHRSPAARLQYTLMRLTRRNPLRLEYDVHHLVDFTHATVNPVVARCTPLTSPRRCGYSLHSPADWSHCPTIMSTPEFHGS